MMDTYTYLRTRVFAAVQDTKMLGAVTAEFMETVTTGDHFGIAPYITATVQLTEAA